MKPIWETWQGKRCRNIRTGVMYIATKDCDWSIRLNIWVENLDKCPCPMPAGHLMFENKSTEYIVTNERTKQ